MMQNIRVSYSSLGTFSTCQRKFEFDKLYPRRVRDGDSYAGDVGKALHVGYQNYLIHKDRDQATWAFMLAFPFQAEQNQTNDYRSFEAALSTLDEMFDSWRMEEYELATIMRPPNRDELDTWVKAQLATGKQIGLDFTPAQAPTVAVPAIEVPFEIRFPGLVIPECKRFPEGASISFIGYMDAIMQSLLTGQYLTTDVKTTRESLADATAKYKFDTQQVPYGICVDHIAKESIDEFQVLYLDSYIDILDPRVTLYQFKKTRQDIMEWATNRLLQFRQLIQYATNDYFPRTEHGCMFYKKPCRYMEPCQSRDYDSIKEWFLMGEEPAAADEFVPWIIADVDLGLSG